MTTDSAQSLNVLTSSPISRTGDKLDVRISKSRSSLACLLGFLLSCLLACLPVACFLAYFFAFLLSCMLSPFLACFLAFPSLACLLPCFPPFLLAFLLAFLLPCLLSSLLPCVFLVSFSPCLFLSFSTLRQILLVCLVAITSSLLLSLRCLISAINKKRSMIRYVSDCGKNGYYLVRNSLS